MMYLAAARTGVSGRAFRPMDKPETRKGAITSPMPESSKPPKPPASATKVQIHYIKSNLFRVISGEGVIGSLSPHGNIFFSVFNERVSLPRAMTHLVSNNGELGETLEIDTRGGVVREMEVGVIMNLEDATRFRDWLTVKISELEEATKARKKNVRKSRKI
jgi:hypothetical protein